MRVALAAPHHEAVRAGERAVAAGGNALDAALAAACTLTVVYPHQCALGGDLIALVRSPAGETTAVVAAGTAPHGIDLLSRNWSAMPRQGVHAVTVPGVVAGWGELARLGARLPLDRVFHDAAEIAQDGTRVSAGLERALDTRRETVLADPGLRSVFAPDGQPLRSGALLRQPALAATLRRLAVDPRDLYEGASAQALVRLLQARGGAHTREDFAGYQPETCPAVTREIAGQVWSVAPPPSVGAILLGVAGAVLDGVGEPHPARLLDASLRGVAARAAWLGDPRTGPADLAALLRLDAGTDAGGRSEPPATGDTVAVVATDDTGWSVTLVQSVFQTFGAGLLEPETGILLHNRGAGFSLDRHSPARLVPGARPPHTLCPVIVDCAEATVVAGCQGGRAQPWILAQLLPAATDLNQPLDQVLARPRWVVGDVDLGHTALTLVAEPGVGEEVTGAARAVGLPVDWFPAQADAAGHVQMVRAGPGRTAGVLQAASDPRADGAAVVVSRP
ncbi:gamma-glutamyltransferase [Micromonospora endophytica]|uniref:Tyramine oxidase n=1 Tax=Micromonospora endophytica TaxID=515350 RepID=A0A2W2D445_9ACTN|nr:gamma-glutamyltransferase [Micromonospora endophytica]PZF92066.1 tyramine oxidase [Micromonospora endophytica]RIW51369.1 tyramine oxidase [Micromonospora endophytica]BCJ62057.1 gamma-glutamyltranspeptidase [Micromonospora endophytica]